MKIPKKKKKSIKSFLSQSWIWTGTKIILLNKWIEQTLCLQNSEILFSVLGPGIPEITLRSTANRDKGSSNLIMMFNLRCVFFLWYSEECWQISSYFSILSGFYVPPDERCTSMKLNLVNFLYLCRSTSCYHWRQQCLTKKTGGCGFAAS